MDVSGIVRQRLDELGLEQKDLAAAAKVTESYISQLLTRKKSPPSSGRTDVYQKMERFLKLGTGTLSQLADLQRKDELKRRLGDPPTPLLKEVRDLVLGKCVPAKQKEMRAIFEKDPFGDLERLVTQRLLTVVKGVAREELDNESWLHLVARLSGRSYERMRVIVLEFLDTDIFSVSVENCVSFLDPLIESWDIDLASFGMDIVLNRRLTDEPSKRFAFVEREPDQPRDDEPGLKEFLGDPALCDASEEEIQFLRKLRFKGRRPNELYYYRELQNLRDPLHFQVPGKGGRPRRP